VLANKQVLVLGRFLVADSERERGFTDVGMMAEAIRVAVGVSRIDHRF
jgi:hypothetical protein